MNTKKQGTIGLGAAIQHYTRQLKVVSLPLNDSQDYDLIVENDDGTLAKVQVKTTNYKKKNSNYYCVELKSSGGNSGRILKTFDENVSDILVIVTLDGDLYEIPRKEVLAKSNMVLNEKLEKYKVCDGKASGSGARTVNPHP